MVKGTAELQRPVPLYMQVTRQLRAQIASGELAEGERIPSQREMMQHWRISMQTASKVIGALKAEGLAIPSIGRDTIVAPGATARISATATGPVQAAPDPKPQADQVVQATATVTKAPPEIAEIFSILRGSRTLRRQETIGDNDQIMSVTTTWFLPNIANKAPMLAESQPLPAGSLAYLAEATGERAFQIHEQIAAVAASPDIAATLGVPPGSPVLMTRDRHENAAGRLIAYAETAAVADNWHARTYMILGS